jgi:hypothetical protein
MQNLQRILDIHDRPKTLRFEDRLKLSRQLNGEAKAETPSFYQIVHVLVDAKDKPKKIIDPLTKDESYVIYTNLPTLDRETSTIPMMLGTFVYDISEQKEYSTILLNPRSHKLAQVEFIGFEEIIFSPLKDPFTKHYMMTSPDQAKALLALNPSDRERFGFEVVFYVVTNQSVSNDVQLREDELQLKIKELAFIAPRVPVKKGSGSFLAIIVNLENKMEESAFIRTYKTFEPYADVNFVTSDLEIKCGDFQTIDYNGDHIDTIFAPLVEWQKNRKSELTFHK